MRIFSNVFHGKNWLTVLLSVVVLVALLVPAAGVWAAGETVAISPANQAVANGAPVSVYVSVNSGTTMIRAFDISISFDADKLTYNGAEEIAAGYFLHDWALTDSTTSAASPTAPVVDNDGGTVTGIAYYIPGGDNPNNGPSGSGNLCKLNFTAKANVNNISDILITAATLTGPGPSFVDITPGVTGGTIEIGDYVPAAEITSFVPTTAGIGDSVVITGSNLTGATSVKFGGVNAASFIVDSDTQITAVVGLGASGEVSVTTAGGTETSAGFTFEAVVPEITSINPTHAGAGASIVITGTGFAGTSSVTFGGTAAASYVINSDTQITAVIGTGSTGDVVVTNNAGSDTLAGAFTFDALAIGSFSPTSAYYGESVLISGAGFSDVSAVKFGGVDALSYEVISSTSISAVVGAAASGSVSVTTDVGTINKTGFTYKQLVLSISPVSQSVNPGANLSLDLMIDTNGNKEMRAWATDVSFDPDLLECTAIIAGDFMSDWVASHSGASLVSPITYNIDNENGLISDINYVIMGAIDDGGATGSGVLITLNFKAKTTVGTAPITLTGTDVTDVLGHDISDILIPNGVVILADLPIEGDPEIIEDTGDVIIDSSLGSQLTFVAPVSISGWNLKVTPNNTVQRTMNVFANTTWQVAATDNDASTDGYLTKYYSGNYYGTKLINPLTVKASSGNGTGASVSLDAGGIVATGTADGQNADNGGDIRDVYFNQAVEYTDILVGSPYSYHMVVTFTASNSSY